MAKAKRTKDRKDWTDELSKRRARKVTNSSLAEKAFEDLTKAEKDEIIKQIAIRFGMIKPS